MASNINVNNIDATFPVAGVSNDSQGFRNNFSNIKDNLSYARRELEDLQNKGIFKSALTGTTLDNSMNGAPFNGAEVYDLRETENNAGILSGTYVLNHSIAHYHSFISSGSVTISFSNLPPTGTVGRFRLKVQITSINHRITLPSSVTQGLSGILGYDGFSNSIGFTVAGIYVFEFFTVDSGTNFNIQDITRGSTLSAPTYVLPMASGSILGGIRVGTSVGLSISGSGVLTYNLPVASSSVLGGVKVNDVSAMSGLKIGPDNTLSMSVASADKIGGIKIGSGLSVDPTTGLVSASASSAVFQNFANSTSSPAPSTYTSSGLTCFNASSSNDFPGQSFAGLTIIGNENGNTQKIGAQMAMGWNTLDTAGNPTGVTSNTSGAPKLMYFRTKDNYVSQSTWSPWTRIMTEWDLTGGAGGGPTTVVGTGGITFPNNPGGGTTDSALIKYFAYSGNKTNLEISVSNGQIGSAGQDSINLSSPGGVGIGKQTPRAALDVNGSAILKHPASAYDVAGYAATLILEASTGNTTNPYLQFVKDGNSLLLGQIEADVNGGLFITSSTSMVFTTNSNVDSLKINDAGLIGVPDLPVLTNGTTARIAVNGLVESTNGGFKFPDGSVQLTASAGAANFPFVQGDTGYVQLPNGFLFQWGTIDLIMDPLGPFDNFYIDVATGYTTFPLAFPTSCVFASVSVTQGSAGITSASVDKSYTTTTALSWTITQTMSGQYDTHTYNWGARGY